MTYAIEATAKPDGPHWASMRDADHHLTWLLDSMAAIVRLSRNEADHEDLERLERDDAGEMHDDTAYDFAVSELDAFALEYATARWDNASGTVARVRFVLGIGGPNVYLDVLCSREGHAETLLLDRYWTQHDAATTDDTAALSIVDDFLSLLLPD